MRVDHSVGNKAKSGVRPPQSGVRPPQSGVQPLELVSFPSRGPGNETISYLSLKCVSQDIRGFEMSVSL